MDKLYKTNQMIALTGVTRRQLQWWDEHKFVVPKRSGHSRVYDSLQALVVMAIKRMRSKGMTPDEVWCAIPGITRALRKTDLRGNTLLLVGMAGHMRIHKDPTTLVYEMANALDQPCWVIDLGQLWALVEDSNIGIAASGER